MPLVARPEVLLAGLDGIPEEQIAHDVEALLPRGSLHVFLCQVGKARGVPLRRAHDVHAAQDHDAAVVITNEVRALFDGFLIPAVTSIYACIRGFIGNAAVRTTRQRRYRHHKRDYPQRSGKRPREAVRHGGNLTFPAAAEPCR